MFRITEQRSFDRLVLKLEGRFSADGIAELDACWRAAMATCNPESIWVDLSDVQLVDVAGQQQLTRMHRAGVRFLTRGILMREVVREIAESCQLKRTRASSPGARLDENVETVAARRALSTRGTFE
jgi:anti-anti-sigma regulatory factor